MSALRAPGLLLGATTSVATWLPAPPSASSHVRKTAVVPARYCGVSTIFGMSCDSQASPVATGQLWVLLQLLGTMNVKRADRSIGSASGTLWPPHARAICV